MRTSSNPWFSRLTHITKGAHSPKGRFVPKPKFTMAQMSLFKQQPGQGSHVRRSYGLKTPSENIAGSKPQRAVLHVFQPFQVLVFSPNGCNIKPEAVYVPHQESPNALHEIVRYTSHPALNVSIVPLWLATPPSRRPTGGSPVRCLDAGCPLGQPAPPGRSTLAQPCRHSTALQARGATTHEPCLPRAVCAPNLRRRCSCRLAHLPPAAPMVADAAQHEGGRGVALSVVDERRVRHSLPMLIEQINRPTCTGHRLPTRRTPPLATSRNRCSPTHVLLR